MKNETLLELQACLDGERNAARSAELESQCAQNPELRALRDQIAHTRELLRQHEPDHRVPVSREFYWRQIERQITPENRSDNSSIPWMPSWSAAMRWLVPIGGLAAAVALFQLPDGPNPAAKGAKSAEPTQLALNGGTAEASSVEYRSESDGVTIHWIH
jgi:anti-sigma factor RsiW